MAQSFILKNAAKVRKLINDPKTHRKESKDGITPTTQGPYWNRFGVTQSGGSRYENGREMDAPLKMLMALRHLGIVGDQDLADLKTLVEG